MMKPVFKLLAALLALCLCAGAAAATAGLDKPEAYLGAWEGGEDYGETREYDLELLDYADGVFAAGLDIYRIWSFEDMTALLTPDAPSAVLSTREGGDYAVLAALDFDGERVALVVLESDFPDLPEGTQIAFERGDPS